MHYSFAIILFCAVVVRTQSESGFGGRIATLTDPPEFVTNTQPIRSAIVTQPAAVTTQPTSQSTTLTTQTSLTPSSTSKTSSRYSTLHSGETPSSSTISPITTSTKTNSVSTSPASSPPFPTASSASATTQTTTHATSSSSSSAHPPTSALPSGAKAGIGIGAALGVLLIVGGAYYLGKRETRRSESKESRTVEGMQEGEWDTGSHGIPELDGGKQAPSAKLQGRAAPTLDLPERCA